MKTCAACDYPHNHANQLACQRCKQKTFKVVVERTIHGKPA